jgi:uncharacterized repeat protein (TIGR03803 family)
VKIQGFMSRACAVLVLCAVAAPGLRAQTFTTLHSFENSGSLAKLVQGNDGNLYGTTWAGGANGDGSLFKVTQRAC